MKFFGTEKDCTGRRTYFFGLKVYEEIKKWNTRKIYLLGIKVRKKRVKESNITLHKMALQARKHAAEQRILSLGLYYKDLAENQRLVLCFDFLNNPHTEAIDAWTLFQYLQEKGIPSKYVLNRKNPLYIELERKSKLKDILLVSSELDFLEKYPDFIAKSRIVFSSFGFDSSPIFKQAPFLKFIFIEHGVMLLKEFATEHYSQDKFDGMVVPTRKTKEMYERMNFIMHERECTQYCCGIPRWDRLSPSVRKKDERKIFIFFTFRCSFSLNPIFFKDYLIRIQNIINRLRELFTNTNVKLYVSLHHLLYLLDPHFEAKQQLEGVEFIPTNEISRMTKEADLCITDYSSIWSDFFYRNVPVIFYCFDAHVQYPHKNDCVKLMADNIEKKLYNCYKDEDSAIAKVRYYAEHDFELESDFVEFNEKIFWQRSDNCENLWNLINKMK